VAKKDILHDLQALIAPFDYTYGVRRAGQYQADGDETMDVIL